MSNWGSLCGFEVDFTYLGMAWTFWKQWTQAQPTVHIVVSNFGAQLCIWGGLKVGYGFRCMYFEQFERMKVMCTRSCPIASFWCIRGGFELGWGLGERYVKFEAFLCILRWIWGRVWLLGWRYVASNWKSSSAFDWMKGAWGLTCTCYVHLTLLLWDLRLGIVLWCIQIEISGVVWRKTYTGSSHVHLSSIHCSVSDLDWESYQAGYKQKLKQYVVFWGVQQKFCDNPVYCIPSLVCTWRWTVQRKFSLWFCMWGKMFCILNASSSFWIASTNI